MKIAYFDNFSGASGDMILAALLDAGLPLDALRQALAPLKLPGYSLSADKIMRHGISATQFVVHLDDQGHEHNHSHDDDHGHHQPHDHGHNHHHNHDAHSHDHNHHHEHEHEHEHKHEHDHHDHDHAHHDHHGHGGHGHKHGDEHHHRSWATIRAMIDDAHLPERAAQRAKAVFQRLAEAEATVHGTPPDKVHFHEVGAVDSIVDIVGAALALELLGIEQIYSAPIPPGSGSVRCAHGVMPVPAPATALLLRGVPTRQSPESGELTTPTGAAILTTLAEQFGPMPSMTPEAIGTGTGSRPGKQIPNILRVFIGQAATPEASETGAQADDYDHDAVMVLETNLDDSTPEIIADAATRFLAAGALDVYTTPVTMKKGRSGVMLSCLTRADRQAEIVRLMLEHTTTFGVRHYETRRTMLRRRHETVTTPYGQVRMKIGLCGETVVRAVPEFEDCRRAAEAASISVQQVMQAAITAWNGNS